MNDPRCEEYRELASAWVDDELRADGLLRLERHLESCAGCRAFEAAIRRTRELLQAGEAIRPLRRPSPGFASRVAALAAAGGSPAVVAFTPRRRARVWVGVAAAAAAAALLFAWSWQRLEPPGAVTPIAAVEPAPAAGVQTAEASMDEYLRRHAMLARDATLLGHAEEIEFASFSGAGR